MHLISGVPHERTRSLYAWGLPWGNCPRRNRPGLCGSQPSAVAAQACSALGGAVRGHDASLATGRQKHRWPPWLAVGCGVVCALDRVDAGEEPQRTRDGSVRVGEWRGTSVHWPSRRPQTADTGSFQHRAGLCRLGQGRYRPDQQVDSACGQSLWVCRCQHPLVRYHSARVAHWVSQRTGYLAGMGPALWPRPGEAQNAGRLGSRGCLRAGADDPQVSQRTPPVCPEQTGKAPGVDTPADRGGPVDCANPSHDRTTEAATRSRHATCHSYALYYARGGQAPHPADCAVDHYWGRGPRQNSACRFAPSACTRAQQGREKGGVWPAVSPESPRWRVYLWDVDQWERGRVEDAHTGACRIPRHLWCAGHAYVGGLRPGRLCYRDPTGADHRGGQGVWHPAKGRSRRVAEASARWSEASAAGPKGSLAP